MLRLLRVPALAARLVPAARVAASPLARSVAQFRGSYIAKPAACVNIRVNHPKYKKSKDGFALTLANPGNISFEIAPAAGGSKSAGDADPTATGFNWEKKLGFNISASDIIQLLSWVPTHEFKTSRTFTPRGVGSDGESVTRTLSLRASEGGVTVTVGLKGELASIELTAIEFQILKTQFSAAIPWLTGWMQQLNPLSYDEATHGWREFKPRTA